MTCLRFARFVLLALFVVAAQAASAARPRVAFFGSSTVAGVGAANAQTRWSALVSRKLGWTELNLGLSSSALSRAQPRDAAPSGVERLDELIATKPDLVVIMYGANDADHHVPIDAFKRDLAECLHRLQGMKIVVLSPQRSQKLVDVRAPYDDALREAAIAAGAIYIDTTAAFPATELAALSADPYHLNTKGHARVARFLEPLLRSALRPAARR